MILFDAVGNVPFNFGTFAVRCFYMISVASLYLFMMKNIVYNI